MQQNRYYIKYSDKILELKAKKNYLIGRKETSDIPITDNFASREHALLSWNGNGFVLLDLKSTNGTYLNEEKVVEKELNNNDIIRIGEESLQFQIEKTNAEWDPNDTIVQDPE